MEEEDEALVEKEEEAVEEADSKVEIVNATPSTGVSQGRKRTRASTNMQATPSPAIRKAKGKASVSALLTERNA